MAQGPASGTITKATVLDAAESYVDGTVQSLSLTNEGRLRVSMVPASFEHVWFYPAEEAMWEECESSPESTYTFTGSPWTAW